MLHNHLTDFCTLFLGQFNPPIETTSSWPQGQDGSAASSSQKIGRKFRTHFHGKEQSDEIHQIQRKKTDCCSQFEQINDDRSA